MSRPKFLIYSDISEFIWRGQEKIDITTKSFNCSKKTVKIKIHKHITHEKELDYR